MRIWYASQPQVFGHGCWHDTNTLDGAKTPKLPFQVTLVSVVAETGNDESLEGIATNVGILVRFDYQFRSANATTDNSISSSTVASLHCFGPSVFNFAAASAFSRFFRSRISSQLSVGW